MPAIRPRSSSAPALWLVLLAFTTIYIVWGSTYLAIRFAIDTMPPLLMAGVRFTLAGLILFAAMRLRDRTPLTAAHWRATARVGVLMLLGGNGLVCWSEQTVPSGMAALMIATMPMWFALLDWLVFRGPRPTARIVVGVSIGLTGMYVLIGPNDLAGDRIELGGAVGLLMACVFWTLGSLWSRRASLPASSFTTTAMQMIAGGAALLLMGLAMGEWSRVTVSALTMKSLLALGYLTVFGSLAALSAYVWLLKVSTPSRVSTYAYVNPVIAVLLGASFAEEPLTPRVWVAVAMIIAAVVLINTARTKPPQTQPETDKNSVPDGSDAPGLIAERCSSTRFVDPRSPMNSGRQSACADPCRTRAT